MSALRSKVALLTGLVAWAAFGVMVVAPRFENEEEFFFGPDIYYASALVPVVFVLALVSFWLGNGSDRVAALATGVTVLVALALLLYVAVPWVWNIFTDGY